MDEYLPDDDNESGLRTFDDMSEQERQEYETWLDLVNRKARWDAVDSTTPF